MPYIEQEHRARLHNIVADLADALTGDEIHDGEVNFCITKLLDMLYNRPPSYRVLERAIGVLECVKLELYRRVIAPYEDVSQQLRMEMFTDDDGLSGSG